MKKAFIPIAVLALSFGSCSTDSNDSYQKVSYDEYNLIIDDSDVYQAADASYARYEMKTYISSNTVEIKTEDFDIDGRKYSFETDTLTLNYSTFKTSDEQLVEKVSFGKAGSAGIGCPVSDISGYYDFHLVRYSGNPYNPGVDVADPIYYVNYRPGLNMRYKFNDRYTIQTFWPESLFQGSTYVTGDNEIFTTKKTDYMVVVDFKKLLATVYIYAPEFSVDQSKEFPKAIRLDKIPVIMEHDTFWLDASSPEVAVLAKKDGRDDFVANSAYSIEEFTLKHYSPDLTQATISYTYNGKKVKFDGCSILKPGV